MARDVVMFVYTDATNDARVWREAATLAEAGWNVTIIGLLMAGASPYERRGRVAIHRVGVTVGRPPGTPSPFRIGGGLLGRARWLGGYVRSLRAWSQRAALAAITLPRSDLVVWHGHDLPGLIAADLAQRRAGGRLVYDSHELFVGAGSAARLPLLGRLAIAKLEDKLAGRADAVITVNDSIASILGDRFRRRPVVVMNCPPKSLVQPPRAASPLRRVLPIGDRRVVLYHGQVAMGRGILAGVRALDHLSDDVVLVVLGDGELVPTVRALAESPAYEGRLFHHPAVPVDELLDWVAGSDIGLIALEPIDTKTYLALPNKLFECISVGVPVVVSDFPELRRVALPTSVGLTCDPQMPTTIAAAIAMLLAEPQAEAEARRARCLALASGLYSWESQAARLLGVYGSLA